MAKRGRPKGTKKEPIVSFHRRVRPEFAVILDKVLEELKKDYKSVKSYEFDSINVNLKKIN